MRYKQVYTNAAGKKKPTDRNPRAWLRVGWGPTQVPSLASPSLAKPGWFSMEWQLLQPIMVPASTVTYLL